MQTTAHNADILRECGKFFSQWTRRLERAHKYLKNLQPVFEKYISVGMPMAGGKGERRERDKQNVGSARVHVPNRNGDSARKHHGSTRHKSPRPTFASHHDSNGKAKKWDPSKRNPVGILKKQSRVDFEEEKVHEKLEVRQESHRSEDDFYFFRDLSPERASVGVESVHSARTKRRRREGQGYTVFISHSGVDKHSMAIPLYNMLNERGIKSFLDQKELRVGASASNVMEAAMETAPIGVFILSIEAAARKWPMKELGCFLERYEKGGPDAPILIPVFYRMGLQDIEDQDLFCRKNSDRISVFREEGFLRRVEMGETSMNEVRSMLQAIGGITGIENDENATNEDTEDAREKRNSLLHRIVGETQRAISHLKTEDK